jgi:hypothetical protein
MSFGAKELIIVGVITLVVFLIGFIIKIIRR